jgi:deazaflavin-dependent oxidoreductase (nitroreductase family)
VPNIRWLLALITAVHRFLYLTTGGRIGGRAGRTKILLLTTIGRRSGTERTVPLLYVEDGGRLAIVPSNAGDDREPAWWLNLKSCPDATVQVGRRRIAVWAREATAEEAKRLWPTLTASYRYYPDYRERTRRTIPIVILERAS